MSRSAWTINPQSAYHQTNCRNTFDWLVTQSHKGAKSEIPIISLVCIHCKNKMLKEPPRQ